ncbi:MAG: hypothetical protein RL662_2201 [Bacteroidota bacterium]|jgi:hypothetical protein
MSSRRDLKKQINECMGLLYDDCILYKVFTKNADQQKADLLIDKISGVHGELLSRVNASESKDRISLYFTKLKGDLKTQLDALGAEIRQLG